MKNWEWVEAEDESKYVAIVVWLPRTEALGTLATMIDSLGGRIIQCREVQHAPIGEGEGDATQIS